MSYQPNSVPLISLGAGYNANNTSIVPAPVITDAANTLGWFTLSTPNRGTNLTANHFGIFVKNGAQYQVPNGKTCKVVAIATSGTISDWQLAHSLTQMSNNATTITSGVYQALAASSYGQETLITNTWNLIYITYEFPSLSYPCFQGDTSGSYEFIMVCREV